MRVRCGCGRYMRFSGFQGATAASGGAWHFSCARCRREAVVYSRHGVDDEPVAGILLTRDGGNVELVYSETADEWRLQK